MAWAKASNSALSALNVGIQRSSKESHEHVEMPAVAGVVDVVDGVVDGVVAADVAAGVCMML